MRLPSLLGLALAICGTCLASKAATSANSISDLKQTLPAPTRFVFDPNLDSGSILSPAQADGDVVCLTMRTYMVRRESPRSDVVRPTGYTTCMESKKIHVMSTVETK
jgi:hypothetical protein